jgi:ABC-type branched-subunit amino acid transport system substrate-binding protein
MRAVLAAALMCLLFVPAAGAATPGVTPTQILLGATGPLTGSESAYAPTLTGAQAYFDYVNAHGGVNGRKIVFKVEDDQYNPVETVQLTQKLVEQDGVFAIFNSIGTEHALAVRDYLNMHQVRQRRSRDRQPAREVPVDDRPAAELHR